jgi:REP element-mobilizing transposase RayT
MPNSYAELYVHFVWATWDRKPLLTLEIEAAVYAAIRAKCHERKCQVRAVGGIADHVHVVVRMPATLDVATLAHDMKGASSHLIRHHLGTDFRWQGAYAAITVCPSVVPALCEYIEGQKEHYVRNRLNLEWEQPENETYLRDEM